MEGQRNYNYYQKSLKLSRIGMFYRKNLIGKLVRNYFKSNIIKVFSPYSVEIAITYQCNLNCIHCSRTTLTDKKSRIPFSLVKKFLQEYSAQGGIYVTLTGGEPTLHPEITNIICLVSGLKMLPCLVSNGQRVNMEFMIKMKQAGLYGYNVSIYGNREFHDQFTSVKGSYGKVIRSLEIAKKLGLASSILYTPLRQSFYDGNIGFMIDLAKKTRVPLNINVPTPTGNIRDKEDFLLGEKERKLLTQLYMKGLATADAFEWFHGNHCPMTMKAIYIAPNGEVCPCPFVQVSFGNIKELSLFEIKKNIVASGFTKFKFEKYECPAGQNKDFLNNFIRPIYGRGKHVPPFYEDHPHFKNCLIKQPEQIHTHCR